MTFKESPRFPDVIARGAEGGPMYNTEIAELTSGHEQRNIGWTQPRHEYRVAINARVLNEIFTYRSFFHAVKGAGIGFRFKDHVDYICSAAVGRMGTIDIGTGPATALGTGRLIYQLYMRYTSGADVFDRAIGKPISGTSTFYRNAVPITIGAAPGNISVDYTQGLVTFVPDAIASISAITQANPGKITTTAAHGFSNGNLVYLSGIGGMTSLNDTVVTVTVVDADEFTIGVNTSALPAYTSGGTASKGPQAADALTWAGQFDVPVRFKSDWFRAIAEARNSGTWPSIELIEVRDLT